MLISILPFAAFGSINTYSSVVKAPDESVEAQIVADGNEAALKDGAEFTVVVSQPTGLLGNEELYIGSSRSSSVSPVDYLSYDDGDDWVDLPFVNGVATLSAAQLAAFTGIYSKSVDFKVVSIASGTSNIVFGIVEDSVREYTKGQDFTSTHSITDIIQQKRFPVQFTSAKANSMVVSVSNDRKPANGVDTAKVSAIVSANNIPVSGKEVTFSITRGSGATLTASRATTDVTGKAEIKIYATKAATYNVQAKSSGITTISAHTVPVVFVTPGIVSIKAESGDNAKVARTGSGTWTRKFSAYDANGNRVNFADQQAVDDLGLSKTVVTKPSGSSLTDSGNQAISFARRSDGYANMVIDKSYLSKDGDYEVKFYLANGSTVSYKFSAKEQGEVVSMELDYGADSYAAGSTLPQPSIDYYDAEGYSISEDYSDVRGDVKLGISDASFIDGSTIATNGGFTLKEDKSGVITMTAVDTSKNLVATQTITIQKAASYLKLTPQSVGAVGGEVTVDIELVDVDGRQVATGVEADHSSATIIARPEGAIASADDVDDADFNDGEASVKVSSSVEGDITLQVIIVDTLDKAYTGACTVSFGKVSGGGQVIFIVGAPSYVAANQVFAAESPAYIENGRTFLGIRDMGSAIGATIEWDQASETATLSKDGTVVKVTVGASQIAVTKSGTTSEVTIDAPAQNNAGRVYLPFRAVMEAFNYTVAYDQATNSIVCTL
jgi:hypothetical protein